MCAKEYKNPIKFIPLRYFTIKLAKHLLSFLALIGELIGYSWSGVRPSSVRRRSQCSKIFFSKTAWPIKNTFYVEPPWVGGTKFVRGIWVTWPRWPPCPYRVKTLQKSLLQNRRADSHETWYVALGTLGHYRLYK